MNIGTMGIVVIILLAGVLNHKQMVETKTRESGTEEIRTDEIETEYMGRQDSSIIYEAIKEFDFSSKEYPINWEIYTPQVEQEYKEAFYMTITNQIPLEYEEEGAVYFRDHLRGVADLDDIEFVEQFVKNSKYRFIDCDGDGLPELLMDTAINGFCILKYRLKEQKVEVYHWLDEYEVLLGSNQIGYSNTTSGHNNRYGYQIMNESGEVEYKIDFTFYYGEDGEEYKISTVGNENMSGYLDQEQWDEVTKDFFEVLKHPVTMVTYEEAFGEDFIGTETLNSMEKNQNLHIRNEVYSLYRERTENLQAPYYVMVNFPQLEDAGDLDVDINKVNLLIKDAAFSMYGETSAEAITRLEEEVRDLNAFEGTEIDYDVLQLENDYISLAFSINSCVWGPSYMHQYLVTINMEKGEYIYFSDLADLDEVQEVLQMGDFEVYAGTYFEFNEEDAHDPDVIHCFVETFKEQIRVSTTEGSFDRFSSQNIGLDKQYLYIYFSFEEGVSFHGYYILSVPRNLLD